MPIEIYYNNNKEVHGLKPQDGIPALAGTVHGVVVHMAKPKSGKNSFNEPSVAGGALRILYQNRSHGK